MRRRVHIDVQSQAQPTQSTQHRSFKMRRLVKISVAFVCLVVVVMVSGLGGLVLDKLVFYGRIARLYTKETDSKIVMPLSDFMKARTYSRRRGLRSIPLQPGMCTRLVRILLVDRPSQLSVRVDASTTTPILILMRQVSK